MGEFDKALKMYNKALPVFETTLGPEHLDVATTYMKYAIMLLCFFCKL